MPQRLSPVSTSQPLTTRQSWSITRSSNTIPRIEFFSANKHETDLFEKGKKTTTTQITTNQNTPSLQDVKILNCFVLVS